MSIGAVFCILCSLVYGKLFEKFNTRLLFAVSTVLTALCVFSYSLASEIWHFYLISVPVGCCSVMLGSTAVSVLITKTSAPEIRGKAMGFAMCGSGLGGMILIPLVSFINETYGWRWSYRAMGLAILLLLLPLVLKYVQDERHSPSKNDVRVSAAKPVEMFMRQGRFWFMMLIMLFLGVVSVTLNNLGFTFYSSLGFPSAKASLLASLMSGSLMVGKLIMGDVCDRLGHKAGIMIAGGLQTLGYLLAFFAGRFRPIAFG